MRGEDAGQVAAFSYISPEQRVPKDHPLRRLLKIVNNVLEQMSPLFAGMYSHTGRPSIPPEKLLRALLLQVLYTIRSERMLMEQLDYNLLFRWFVGLNMDDAVWDATVFTRNRDRVLGGEVAEVFFEQVVEQARRRGLLSDEHFTVDGTLIEAWASHKSYQPKDPSGRQDPPSGGGRNPDVDFRKQRRKSDTHASRTDPDARLYRKSKGSEAKLCYMGHLVVDNRHGLPTNAMVTKASGTAERDAAVAMAGEIPGTDRVTMGGDKNYDTKECVGKAERSERNAACGAERHQQTQRDRWPHHEARRVQAKPGQTQAHRAGLWLGQDSRTDPQDEAPRDRPRRLDVRLHRGSVHLGENAQSRGADVKVVGPGSAKPPLEVTSEGSFAIAPLQRCAPCLLHAAARGPDRHS